MNFRRTGRILAVILVASLLFVAGFVSPFRISEFGIRKVSAIHNPKSPIRNAALSLSKGPQSEIPKLPPAALAKIEPLVLKQIIEEGRATFIVYLREQADLSSAAQIKSLAERRLTVFDTLRSTAQRSQRDILAFLGKQEQAGHASDIIPLWIFNGVAVTGDGQTLADIANREDVIRIRANHVRHLPEPVPSASSEQALSPGEGPVQNGTEVSESQIVLWNIKQIRADAVWDDLGITGRGVVVASLDTGVDWQHNALRDKYRGRDEEHDYDWFDPTGTYPQAPNDNPSDPIRGHGTHTMGAIVGDGVDESGERLRIGVAPGAQWVAVKVFDDTGAATDLWIHQGFQWILAPTDLQGENPDPSKAPDVVNNSWGNATNGADITFRPDVLALRAAGIVPVFAAGNLRQVHTTSGTVTSPAAFPESIAVGATDPDDLVASFSAHGPSFWDELKPEFSAPGQYIRSSAPGDKYSVVSGTSFSAPHVAGSIALMLEAAHNASNALAAEAAPPVDGMAVQRADPMPSIDDLEQLLALTASDVGAPGPDNEAGAGRIDAYRATVWAMTAGKLYGNVRASETGAPIVAAEIAGTSVTNPEDQFTTRSQSDGEYSVAVPKGHYSINVTAFGYEPATINNVEVVAGFLALRDIELKRSATGMVAGQIRTADGVPIQATVEVVDTPVRAQTDGKGTYSIDLPAGTHTLRVTTAGYRTETAEVAVTVGERTVQTFVLTPAPSTLFIDGDQWVGDNVSVYYEFVLNKAGIPFDTRPITTTENVPTVEELSVYDIVVWAHPWTSPGTIDQRREDSATVDALTGYLAQGGRLLLTGQDIGWLDGGGNPANPSPLAYYEDFLHARFTDNSLPRNSTIIGTSDDIVAGIDLQFDTTYAYKRTDNGFSPDGIEPMDDTAQVVFEYNDGAGAGIKVQAGNYRLVYLSFAAETTGPRESLIDAFA
ncbi:MAG: S8 family serine peptidase, partial [Anaerolineae bacterium]